MATFKAVGAKPLKIRRSSIAAQFVVDRLKPITLLDVGSGDGTFTRYFRQHGIDVTAVNLEPPADFIGRFEDYQTEQRFDAVWLSHVLEHVRNVGEFLEHCKTFLNDRGCLVVTVPPMKPELVGGHINLFTMGTLVYQLILAGYVVDWIHTYGYNLSVCARASAVPLPQLQMDNGDIERLRKYFPVEVWQGCDGNLANWSRYG